MVKEPERARWFSLLARLCRWSQRSSQELGPALPALAFVNGHLLCARLDLKCFPSFRNRSHSQVSGAVTGTCGSADMAPGVTGQPIRHGQGTVLPTRDDFLPTIDWKWEES